MNAKTETARLQEARWSNVPWKKWGPYLSERQWGTVREDYSQDGNAWDYFSHDQARSRAYRWGEDGLAGICDDEQLLCFGVALWNGRDPILKERLFGLTNSEGNHGEDVKEYYFYLDSTPTHSYMKYLYKYPQTAFPYDDLVKTNRLRNRSDMEYELLDTGVFDGDRYFDVFVEYAKNTPEDILIQISVCNRGPEAATLHVLPTLWFRNTWTWSSGAAKPALKAVPSVIGARVMAATHPELGDRFLYCESRCSPAVHGERDQQRARFRHTEHRHLCQGRHQQLCSVREEGVINPEMTGTKASAHYQVTIEARSNGHYLATAERPTARLDESSHSEISLLKSSGHAGVRRMSSIEPSLRTGLAKTRPGSCVRHWRECFGASNISVSTWTNGSRNMAPIRCAHGAPHIRNSEWFHMVNENIISMPDKWEYPWYAAWDLAFHAIALSTVDVDFAKEQLELLLQEYFLHPTGQIPAYEWNFGDVNPPVHAWATIFLYRTEQALHGDGDIDFLRRSFRKLMLNFSWWINRKDRFGKNVFECGFLGSGQYWSL